MKAGRKSDGGTQLPGLGGRLGDWDWSGKEGKDEGDNPEKTRPCGEQITGRWFGKLRRGI